MHAPGHVGTALLVYSPIGLVLLLVGFDELAVLGGVGMVALATFPDCDHRLPVVSHRGPTHSILFALAVGAGLASAGFLFGEIAAVRPGVMAAFAFAIGALAILSHLAADSITPMGIRPLWPLSRWHYSADIVRAKNPIANYLLLAVGLAAATGALVVAATV
ncbi:metal-dependent hydrolase [Halalkalicoccus jeotgali]|uniref:Membrane-bound metal-dependent hydrolase n=1 Tax=Halalkalicoccus jeotgali (strain DSM 18796 / CECT 7217 / JCM 14584 / KCTC 4019 / B3) TaxID=795797 RepID=D8J3Y1_HALJB|nr:metal-dependent hydrolase [Halalkalicoccus jeotgali]ADJ15373.1 membrane-bound metal-dependent hydrolase [Halalkalicoccus jeotgali B3]ELY35414.1 membrane-bound metal-dependent hydrolase [Halalkalicoccus jeotgali B3]